MREIQVPALSRLVHYLPMQFALGKACFSRPLFSPRFLWKQCISSYIRAMANQVISCNLSRPMLIILLNFIIGNELNLFNCISKSTLTDWQDKINKSNSQGGINSDCFTSYELCQSIGNNNLHDKNLHETIYRYVPVSLSVILTAPWLSSATVLTTWNCLSSMGAVNGIEVLFLIASIKLVAKVFFVSALRTRTSYASQRRRSWSFK